MQVLINKHLNPAVHMSYAHNANSSSSHTVLLASSASSGDSVSPMEYGWEWFVLKQPHQKKQYIIQELKYNPNYSPSIAEKLFPGFPFEYYDPEYGYIDHESVHTIEVPDVMSPMSFIQQNVWAVWCRYVIDNPAFVILGGNDNERYRKNAVKMSVESVHDEIANFFEYHDTQIDTTNDVTVLFSPSNGKRLIIDWQNHGFPSVVMPALVDLKITDYCGYGCSFCYQGSTRDGKHVPIEELESILDILKLHNVCEVVVGGGEPTKHPHFKQFLKKASDLGLSVSFTTKNETWIASRAEFWLDQIKGTCAFSVERLSDIERIYAKFIAHNRKEHLSKVQFQVIDKVTSDFEFTKILKFAFINKLTVTMLGYKTTGRGQSYLDAKANSVRPLLDGLTRFISDLPDLRESDGIDRLIVENENEGFKVLCDTVMSQSLDMETLNKMRRNRYHFELNRDFIFTEEGLVSCYIDPLQNKICKSSYHRDPDDTFVYDKFNAVNFQEGWAKVRTPVNKG